jgi:hypothetical protein
MFIFLCQQQFQPCREILVIGEQQVKNMTKNMALEGAF